MTENKLHVPAGENETERMAKELAILTRVIERQQNELDSMRSKSASTDPTPFKRYALGIIEHILNSCVEEVIARRVGGSETINLDLTDVLMSIIGRTELYNDQWYMQTNRDVADSGLDGLYHYAKYGLKEQRCPNSRFL